MMNVEDKLYFLNKLIEMWQNTKTPEFKERIESHIVKVSETLVKECHPLEYTCDPRVLCDCYDNDDDAEDDSIPDMIREQVKKLQRAHSDPCPLSSETREEIQEVIENLRYIAAELD